MERLKATSRNLKLLSSLDLITRLEELERLLGTHELTINERVSAFEQRHDTRADNYERAIDTRLDERQAALDQRLDSRDTEVDARLETRLQEREATVDARLDARESALDTRLDQHDHAVDARLEERLGAVEARLSKFIAATEKTVHERISAVEQHLAAYEKTLDQRLDERDKSIDKALQERDASLEKGLQERDASLEKGLKERDEALGNRLTERDNAIDSRLAEREIIVDTRFDERFEQIELRLDQRLATAETSLDTRHAATVTQLTERAQQYETALDERFDSRLTALEARNDAQQATIIQRVDTRLDEQTRAFDQRFDDRFARGERTADERFETIEKRIDTRMEAHEKRTDSNLKLNRADILDRTDIMLQFFEQRLDQQRRELKALRAQLAREQQADSSAAPSGHAANGHAMDDQSADDKPAPHITLPAALAQTDAVAQVQSFRQLAQSSGLIGKNRLATADALTLYDKILDWKKVSGEGFNQYTADEQTVVDYVLSFITDPAELHYVQQHLRRFLSTLQRIPPPVRSTDRLLELGSLLHFVPALQKFTDYKEIYGSDFWEAAATVSTETLKQVHGNATHTIELQNFNVETDPFPYPDEHFQVVLCCELIEHLQRDPLHMLWECNRVLQPDGYLLLTTPNIASARSIEGILIGCSPYLLSQYNRETPADQHNREYAPYEVGIALAAAGFTILELETEDVWLRSNPAILKMLEDVNLPTDLRGDNIYALARKTSPPLERFPKELYVQK